MKDGRMYREHCHVDIERIKDLRTFCHITCGDLGYYKRQGWAGPARQCRKTLDWCRSRILYWKGELEADYVLRHEPTFVGKPWVSASHAVADPLNTASFDLEAQAQRVDEEWPGKDNQILPWDLEVTCPISFVISITD